jgi:formate C-acetyltransferase
LGGFADTVNSLYAIRKLVYEEKKCTLPQLLAILAKNWEGEEILRRYVQSRYTYFGNDNDDCDCIAVSLAKAFAAICRKQEGRCGYGTPPGISTFGRQLEWAPYRMATPYGRKAGDVLAGNCSPTPGTDKEGATAVIRSYCKLDLAEMTTGAALDLKLLPSAVKGEDGIAALTALMQGFVTLGGFFLQLDVADASILREAQEHPEEYATLSVRVSGWNARFVTLDRGWQDMIINQTEEHS